MKTKPRYGGVIIPHWSQEDPAAYLYSNLMEMGLDITLDWEDELRLGWWTAEFCICPWSLNDVVAELRQAEALCKGSVLRRRLFQAIILEEGLEAVKSVRYDFHFSVLITPTGHFFEVEDESAPDRTSEDFFMGPAREVVRKTEWPILEQAVLRDFSEDRIACFLLHPSTRAE